MLLCCRKLDRHHLRRHEEHSSYELLRPGFTRLSLPYFMSEPEVMFVMEAVKMVATEGWKLLPQYIVNPETGEWRHHTNSVRVSTRPSQQFSRFLNFSSYSDLENSLDLFFPKSKDIVYHLTSLLFTIFNLILYESNSKKCFLNCQQPKLSQF